MASRRQLVAFGCGLALLGVGAGSLAVCSAVGPRTEVIDATVRAPDAPEARVATLTGWRGARVDTLSETRTRVSQGSIGRVAIREADGELVLRSHRTSAGEPETPLAVLRVDLATGTVTPTDTLFWDAAGPATTLCASSWGGLDERVTGDPWTLETPRTPFPNATGAMSDVSAGAHEISTSMSADGHAVAVISGAGPRTETRVILGGWEAIDGAHYLEVFSLPERTRLAGPVRLPPDDEPARMAWPRPCWSPSGQAVVVLLHSDPYALDAMRLVLLTPSR